MKFWICIFLIISPALPGQTRSESMSDRSLRQLVERQRDLLDRLTKAGDDFDEAGYNTQMQQLCQSYESFLRDNSEYAAGYAAYGYLLGKIGMERESAVMLLKANQYDPDIPLVKNQLGNYLAEHGHPLEAVNYYLAAIKLAPNEPLYHYQLGTLLHHSRDEFLKSGEWTRDGIDQAMHEGFRQAAELAPDRFEFAYRFAESFYDLEQPDWQAAISVWAALEERAGSAIERQTMRLHAANVCLKMEKYDHARALIATVTEPALEAQKQKLVAKLPATAEQ
jgi:tetratricopeptide (TPR) repeat protein